MAIATPPKEIFPAEKPRQTFPFLVALERSHVPSVVMLPDSGKFTWLNPAAKALLGEVRGEAWPEADILPPGSMELAEGFWGEILARGIGSSARCDLPIKGVDGSLIPVSVSAGLMDAGGHTVIFAQFYPLAAETPAGADHRRNLTPRQHEILQRIARGESTSEIARALYLSNATVKTHVRRILAALKVSTRAEAVAIAYREGLL